MKQTKSSKRLLSVIKEYPDWDSSWFGIRLTADDIELLNSSIRKGRIDEKDIFVVVIDRKPALRWFSDGYECTLENLDKHFPNETLNELSDRIKSRNTNE